MLTFICSELGFLDEAVTFGKRSMEISLLFPADRELVRHSFVGLGLAYYYRGESKMAYDVGKELLDYGKSHYDLPCDLMGHQLIGISHLVAGDFPKAIESFRIAIELSEEPRSSLILNVLLGLSYVSCGQIEAAENTLNEIMRSDFKFGDELVRTAAHFLLGFVSIAKGQLSRGVSIIEDQIRIYFENDSRYRYAMAKYMLGRVYLHILQRSSPVDLSALIKNIGFVVQNVPFASKKAEHHFNKAIEVAKEIGAKGVLGQAYLGLGFLHRTKKRTGKARECITEAVKIFEETGAEVFLKQAKEALMSLG
jgi:tetratricopeptide (TPR) repeat protein